MADPQDITGLLAPQSLVSDSLGPSVFGWIFQIFLCGSSTTLVFKYFRSPVLRRTKYFSINNVLLLAAVLCNLAVTGMNCNETYHYLISQNRSVEAIYTYTNADIWITIPQGAVALFTQIFFALRCYYLIEKSVAFAATVGSLILTAFVGSILCAVMLYVPFSAHAQLAVAELWLWSGAAADVLIAGALIYTMSRKKQGFNRETDDLIDRVSRLALETAALPTLVAVIAAIIFICTYKSPTYYNTFAVFVDVLPSIYVFTFVEALSFRLMGPESQQYAGSATFGTPTIKRTTVTMPSIVGVKSASEGTITDDVPFRNLAGPLAKDDSWDEKTQSSYTTLKEDV